MYDKKFRPDINGLRAFSVISVVLYHFGVPYISGGFVGVDVFFVISGFLMTGIVIEKNDLKGVLAFYVARFLRIVPALLTLVFALLTFGYFSFSTGELELFARNALASLLFYSNNYYAAHSSYFDPTSELNFLLHTWSLSVEWQFYLVYPLIILGIKNARISLFSSIFSIWFISVILVEFNAYNAKEEVFYLLPTRAWEMLTGGLVFLISKKYNLSKCNSINKFSIVGLLFIFISFFTAQGDASWPGVATLVPVAGAAIFIITNNQKSFIVNNKPIQFIGLISYSWYLWHWPIIVAMKYYKMDLSAVNIVTGIALSFLVSVLSFYFIESPFRKRKHIYLNLTLAISIAVCSSALIITNGASYRFAGAMNDVVNYRFNNDKWSPDTCFLNPNQTYLDFEKCKDTMTGESIVVWGDSHAAHLIPGFRTSFNKESIIQRTSSLCGPLIGAENPKRMHCKETNDFILNEILTAKPKIVVISAFWSQYPFNEYLPKTLDKLTSNGIKAIVIGPVPYWQEWLPKELQINGINTKGTLSVDNFYKEMKVVENDKIISKIVSQYHNAEYISALNILCDKSACQAIVNGSKPMQWDKSHFSNEGSKWFVSKIKTSL